MNIGDRIKQCRLELGLSADELAQKIGKSRATVYRYENGDIENMPTTVLEPIAKALNTTPANLIGWEEPENHLKKRRKELGLLLSDVADKMQVGEDTVKKWEEGNIASLAQNPNRVKLLASILDVNPVFVLGLDLPIEIAQNPEALEFYLNSNAEPYEKISDEEISLVSIYRKLQRDNQKKMYDYGNNLLNLQKFEEEQKFLLNAAHHRTDVDQTTEGKASDDAIMDDDDEWK